MLQNSTRDKIIELLIDFAEESLLDINSVASEHMVGRYTTYFNELMEALVKASWFDDLSQHEKNYAVAYTQIRYAKMFLDFNYGGDIDEAANKADLIKLLEFIDVETDPRSVYVEPLLDELNSNKDSVATVALTRKIRVLYANGVEAFERYTENAEEKE